MGFIALVGLTLQEHLPGPIQKVIDFIDTPAPYSPFTEYLAVLFLLWLLARRDRRNTFDARAQEVLDQKLSEGEIDKKTYEKYRQEMSLRPKR
ncbi:MAG: hypothetical protein ACREMA_03115 [Longimicrobiales bacterium]